MTILANVVCENSRILVAENFIKALTPPFFDCYDIQM